MDDRTAISRIKQGDLDSLEHLVCCYQGQAVHDACLILNDRAQAEAVCLEVGILCKIFPASAFTW